MTVVKVDFKKKTREDGTSIEVRPSISFEEIIKKNQEAEDNLKKKRAKVNENVMKSYGIK